MTWGFPFVRLHTKNDQMPNAAFSKQGHIPDRFSRCHPRSDVNRLHKLATASRLLQLNIALDLGINEKESPPPPKS